jgi:hypothetical protein
MIVLSAALLEHRDCRPSCCLPVVGQVSAPDEPRALADEAAGPFLTIGEVSVWTHGGDRLRVETPDGAQEVEGIERARELAHLFSRD